jgi:HlyD family secretion protein
LFDPASRSEAESRWHVAGDELDAAVATALAAEASRDRQHAALRRAESLSAQQLIAADQRDEIRAQAVAAESNVRSAQARAQAARVRRDSARAVLDLQGAASRGEANRLSLSSPIHGRVIRRLVESEGVVRAGQALLEVGDPSDLEVIVEALTADAVRVGPGTRVRLLRWGGDAPLRGRVQTIEPGGFTKVSALGVEEQRVLVVIALDGPRDKRSAIGDGFRVEAEFLVWEAGNVLTVPVAALFRDGREWAVYAIDDGRARMRRVEIGHFGENAAEVRAGLREGAHVILYPGDRLRDGARVEYRTP